MFLNRRITRAGALFWLMWTAVAAQAQDAGPYVCSGLASVEGVPGAAQKDRTGSASLCPPGQALMGVSGAGFGNPRPPKFISVEGGDCCPIPEGILTDEHLWAEESCPEGSIATGGRPQPSEPGLTWETSVHEIRCTKIDSSRFVLGPERPGEKYGVVESRVWATVFGIQELHTTRAQLPVALRYGLGRRSLNSWSVAGCVGSPPGSLLVGKTGNRCPGFMFRRLMYLRNGSVGEPVPLLPECIAVDDLFSAEPKCIKAQAKEKSE